jgi:hypothetical protein
MFFNYYILFTITIIIIIIIMTVVDAVVVAIIKIIAITRNVTVVINRVEVVIAQQLSPFCVTSLIIESKS